MSLYNNDSALEDTIPQRLKVSFEYAARTDIGKRRKENEDSFLAAAPIFLVADGMGGHESGALAARTVADSFRSVIGRSYLKSEELRDVLAVTAERVDSLGSGGLAAPGSTISGFVVSEQGGLPCIRVFNIGDSRTYQLSNDHFSQITVDHSEVQELVDSGRITKEQARTAESRNVITRALGALSGPEIVADHFLLPALKGDRYLICSDGLTSELTDQEIEEVLRHASAPNAAVEQLVDLALSRGARDNVTVIVADVVQTQPSWQSSPTASAETEDSSLEQTKDSVQSGKIAQISRKMR